ncbi:auxin efflux carrier component 7-like [Dendrobium catenatum]|uniref:Auxin efflux carrier component n=1 Tax=Dendrobium catenatum TaxID=906689 RepID=A0A2I0VKY7_9ASPA|nr:auxin efflux carrier component 7-like [Dendrobium catenatum]PKU64033.1 Putative auxin efflux carrier component 8 [Dendrobium catenatum]
MTPNDLYNVLSALVPQYITMFLAFASVKYWKIFSPEQCFGINRFVAHFACPFLFFDVISRFQLKNINIPFLAADSISKVLVLLILLNWVNFFKSGSLEWLITLFSLTTLPNTLIVGIPLLTSMYGNEQEGLMIQVVVMQCIIWFVFLLFLYEFRAARNSIMMNISEKSAQLQNNIGAEDVHISIDEENIEGISELQGSVNCSEGVYEKPEQSRDIKESEGKETEKVESGRLMMIKLIMKTVCFKLVRNPNAYASLLGLLWILISSRLKIKKPLIMDNSVKILSNTGQGLAVFSLGLFMALQPRIISCGIRLAVYGMLMRFLAGPATMLLSSVLVGLRKTTLSVAVVQAALPQAALTFVYAKEYDLHSELLSTVVIFGMIASFPVTILYSILLGL